MNALFGGINDWLHRVWFKPGNSDLTVMPDGSMTTFGPDWNFMYILWVSIISFVLLMGVMGYWTLRWRRRPGVAQIRTPNHNTVLEVIWVVVPLILVTLMFFWGFHGYMKGQIAPANAVEINITGKKWAWSASYPQGFDSTEKVYLSDPRSERAPGGSDTLIAPVEQATLMVVQEGVPLKLKMISDDVIHSFFIPDMRIKMDVFPNRYTSLTFKPMKATLKTDEHGNPVRGPKGETLYKDHYVFCAEYCGNNHSEMIAAIRVLPKNEYDAWLADAINLDKKYRNADGSVPEGGDASTVKELWQFGELLYTGKGCNQCHSLDGSPKTGPSWKGYMDGTNKVEISRGPAFDGDWDNYIRRSILEPQSQIHKGFETGNMPSYQGQITEKGIAGIIAFFKHLNGLDGQPTGDKPKPAPVKN